MATHDPLVPPPERPPRRPRDLAQEVFLGMQEERLERRDACAGSALQDVLPPDFARYPSVYQPSWPVPQRSDIKDYIALLALHHGDYTLVAFRPPPGVTLCTYCKTPWSSHLVFGDIEGYACIGQNCHVFGGCISGVVDRTCAHIKEYSTAFVCLQQLISTLVLPGDLVSVMGNFLVELCRKAPAYPARGLY